MDLLLLLDTLNNKRDKVSCSVFLNRKKRLFIVEVGNSFYMYVHYNDQIGTFTLDISIASESGEKRAFN